MKARFRIVEFTNPSGETVYRVDGKGKDGKRIRANFKTEAEATGRKQELEAEVLNLPSTPLVSTRLTPSQVQEAELAFAALEGKPLTGAVRFYLDNYREPVIKTTLEAALAEFERDKLASNKRPLTIQNVKNRVKEVIAQNPGKLVSDILPEHLKPLVQRPGVTPVTKSNIRRALSSFFGWAVAQQFCASNPVASVSKIKVELGEPEILPLADVNALLQAANQYKDGATLPYVALGLFCAIRPEELSKLTWGHINLKKRSITISADIAKLRKKRIVEISKNCAEWLAPHALKQTAIRGTNWRRDFDAVKTMAGYAGRDSVDADGQPLKPWPVDVMRHTGISNHLALHEHEGKTALWAGNSPDMIQKHYKGLVEKPSAKKFWSISPSDAAQKILKLKAA